MIFGRGDKIQNFILPPFARYSPLFAVGGKHPTLRLESFKSDYFSENQRRKAAPSFFDFGRDDKIRTCDFYVPNVALYQTEPHLVIKLFLAPRALPVAVTASRFARCCSRSATAATPYCSLTLPQAALANVPKLSHTPLFTKVLYHKKQSLSSVFLLVFQALLFLFFLLYQLSNWICTCVSRSFLCLSTSLWIRLTG